MVTGVASLRGSKTAAHLILLYRPDFSLVYAVWSLQRGESQDWSLVLILVSVPSRIPTVPTQPPSFPSASGAAPTLLVSHTDESSNSSPCLCL